MKKMTYFVMALAMVLGLAQCKKEQPAPQNETQGVRITLNVENGGGRHAVDPSTGAVNYTDGDKIYVGNGSTYIGTLTRNSGVFTGNIEEQADGTKLYFYFLSVHIPEQELVSGETTNISISIEDQSSTLCVVSLGDATYHTGIDSYSCTLKNQCALVKLSLANEASTVVLAGRYGMARVGFASPGIYTDPGVYALRNITFHPTTPSTEKWAILLLQDATPGATVTVDGTEFTVDIPVITRNGYVTGIEQIDNPAAPVARIVDLSARTEDYEAQDGDILTGELASPYKVTIAAGAIITLEDATISGGIIGLGDVTIILSNDLLETNTVSNTDGPGLRVPDGNTLFIRGEGSLTATGASGCAGIGSGNTPELVCGDIEIQNGTVIANGGEYAAGIGTGGAFLTQLGVDCGNITITGGTVTAKGCSYEIAAGIGTGNGGGQCGDITISGGTVTASGGGNNAGGGAGIGAGYTDARNITISGGTVIATGGGNTGSGGTGIGVGGGCSVGIITLSGGNITATGGGSRRNPAYGIGGSTSKCEGIVITTGVESVIAKALTGIGNINANKLTIDEIDYEKDPTGVLGVSQVLQASIATGTRRTWTLTHIE